MLGATVHPIVPTMNTTASSRMLCRRPLRSDRRPAPIAPIAAPMARTPPTRPSSNSLIPSPPATLGMYMYGRAPAMTPVS